jgi:hypothetical protein
MKAQTYSKLSQLLCYMGSSARGLLDEPVSYGPFRLIDGVSRLIGILEEEGIIDEELSRIKGLIEQGKFLAMTDHNQFKNLLDEVVIALADWINNI